MFYNITALSVEKPPPTRDPKDNSLGALYNHNWTPLKYVEFARGLSHVATSRLEIELTSRAKPSLSTLKDYPHRSHVQNEGRAGLYATQRDQINNFLIGSAGLCGDGRSALFPAISRQQLSGVCL